MTCERFLAFLLAPLLALILTACDVDVEDEGELPEVDVQGGRLPEVDVDTPDVDIETEERTVDVPTGIDIDPPEDDDPDEFDEP